MQHLSLAEVSTVGAIVLTAGGLVLGAGGALALLRLIAGRTVFAAKQEAARVLERAESERENLLQKAEVEAEKVVIERQRAFEKEAERQREEIREHEKRLGKREDLLDRQRDTLAVKEENLAKASEAVAERERKVEARNAELDELLEKQRAELMRVADLTPEQAKERVLKMVEEESREDIAKVVRKIVDEGDEEAEEKAREMVLMAIQRCAAEQTAESTVRVVSIPSDDMKGRIIGREGRNIRAIEKSTGADIIVDDTPGVIVVSCFDKVRQTVAAESLSKLIADGRVHPSRIEEVVAQCQKEVEDRIQKAGKEAVLELKLRGLHSKVVEAMGRLHFRASYGQNVLRHSVEVGILSQLIAEQLGLDGRIAKRCGFLHDIGKAMDHEMEGGHPKIGMDFAKQHGETEPVLNAIGGHHADIPSTSYYTPIVMAADAISGSRPGARRESLERYIQRLEHLQEIALREKGVDEAHAIQAGREVRVMVDAKRVNDDEAVFIAKRVADQVSEEMTFPGEIRVTVLRETRAVEIAR